MQVITGLIDIGNDQEIGDNIAVIGGGQGIWSANGPGQAPTGKIINKEYDEVLEVDIFTTEFLFEKSFVDANYSVLIQLPTNPGGTYPEESEPADQRETELAGQLVTKMLYKTASKLTLIGRDRRRITIIGN